VAPADRRTEHSATLEKEAETAAKAQSLVLAGQQATLLLHSKTFRVTADVIPLERGTMGQRIRVRIIDTGKIFSAQVDGRAHLDTTF
jgi:flagella basal body P-ring formation protein FlgA